MVDGFFWTRVTSKYLRFLYEDIAFEDLPAPMRERAQSVDAAPEAPALEPTPREGEH
jgi:hypothetical protein